MALMPYVAVVGLLIFAGMSFFFALAESALFSLGKWQVRQLAERVAGDGRLGGEIARRNRNICWRPSCSATPWRTRPSWPSRCGPRRGGIGCCSCMLPSLFVLLLVGCEVIPKTLAVRAPEQWALRVARPMDFLQGFTGPFQRVAQQMDNVILADARAEIGHAAVRDVGRGISGIARTGVSTGDAGAVGKGNHFADHRAGPADGEGRDEAALADGRASRMI